MPSSFKMPRDFLLFFISSYDVGVSGGYILHEAAIIHFHTWWIPFILPFDLSLD